ncbi:MAG: (5-formylfuran-3-yl)methyl phosphate synthase [Geminicoccaceae bacterium]
MQSSKPLPAVQLPGLLASVADLAEVELALPHADLIDLKDPAQGALGAWPLARIAEAVRLVDHRRPVSATVGDLPPDPEMLAAAARATAGTGVDFVKLGFFPGGDHRRLARELATVAADGVALVAVLMADHEPDYAIVSTLGAAGFRGVMLDTADKAAGSLLAYQTPPSLTRFVTAARARSLLTGLAGSLRVDDIATLAPIGADFLGFRGALCARGRAAALDPARLAAVRAAVDRSGSPVASEICRT